MYADFLYHGTNGVEEDKPAAHRAYIEAGSLGNVRALECAAEMFLEGAKLPTKTRNEFLC